jgi:RNA-binding protein
MPNKDDNNKPKSIGTVMHVSKSTGQLIVLARNEVSIGDFVYNGKRKRVGVVFDFFGPVNAPYIAVKPHDEELSQLEGVELFVEDRKRNVKRR